MTGPATASGDTAAARPDDPRDAGREDLRGGARGPRPRWWSRRSLRFRVSAAAAAFVAFALLIAGAGLVYGVRDAVLNNLDTALEQRATDVAALAQTDRLPAVLPASAESVIVVQVLDAHGGIVSSPAELPAGIALLPLPLPAQLAGENPATVSGLPLPDHRAEHRVIAVSAPTPAGSITVLAAGSLAELDLVSTSLLRGLGVGIPALVALIALTTWALTGYTLRPVEQLRRRAAAITASDLHRRLPEPDARDEIHTLAVTLNAMLARLDAAAATQRGFVADAAHELRSPLAAIRAQIDVARAHPDSIDPARLHTLLDQDTTRLQQLIDDLLLLARADDPTAPAPQRVAVDLDDIVLAEQRRITDTGTVSVDATGISAGRVRGDPAALRRMVRNLLDNAARHATALRITLRSDGEHVVLVIADNGRGVPPEQRARVFDRFTRLDDARTRHNGGVGLGLAIVAQIVHSHSAAITVDQDLGPPHGLGGARFTITMPAST